MRSIFKIVYITFLALCIPILACAQSDRSHIRQGNRTMRANAQDGASKAEVSYRKAMSANQNNPQALYNLGCALMAQQKDSLAMEMFQKAAKIEKSPVRKAKAFHNMGVLMQKQQQYGPAIEMYKQALRLTPHDNESRYNLVLCQRQKKDEQNNQNNQGGNNKDQNKDQNKDKNKDKNDNKDKNNDKDKDQKKDQQDKQQQQQQQQKMSKENAEQLLNAAMQDEKATQQRMKKAMQQPRRRNIQKNW